MSTQLSLHAVRKSYGERIIFDGVTHAITPGGCTGVVGENGSGKSTLLRLLAGREDPDAGRVIVVAEGGLGYLGQDAELPGHLRVRQVIDDALAELRQIEARLRALEARLAAGNADDLAEYADLTTASSCAAGTTPRPAWSGHCTASAWPPSTTTAGSTTSPAASRPGCASRRCWPPARRCCFSTSRPTTWTTPR